MIKLSSIVRVSPILLASLLLSACAAPLKPAANTTQNKATTMATEFDQAVDALSRTYYGLLPETATYNGVPEELAPGASTRLSDRSIAGEQAKRKAIEEKLAVMKSSAPSGLSPQKQRIRESMITLFDGALGPARVAEYGSAMAYAGVWYLPYTINHNSGPLVDIPSLMEAQHTVTNDAQAQAYISRLSSLAKTIDDAIEKTKHDVVLGAIAPDFILDKAISMIDGFVAHKPQNNVLYSSFAEKLATAELKQAESFAASALALVSNEVIPAYKRAGDYLRSIRPDAPHDAGVWRLPNGEALYKAMIRHMTDSALDAKDVHEIGLAEVTRITEEMDTLLKEQGYSEGSVGERMTALGIDKRFLYPNNAEGKAALLSDIQQQMDNVTALLPQWFGTLPNYEVEVRPVPAFSEESAPGGYYDNPAPDGSRPGIYWINLRDTAIWPSFAVPTLTYHEAIPGHHMQVAISIAQDQPLLASSFWSNPTGEGWGLYAEALAAEMGLYDNDPFGNLGRLQDEIHRAIRLVVDTGMHALKWSREEAIDYMVKAEGVDHSEAVSEVERYVVWPGQALGYKIGMLKIQELRRDAEAAFGKGFDIKEFHDRILRVSSSALPVIESEIRSWIATTKPR